MSKCEPPAATPDGTHCWLRNDKSDGWCVAVWSHDVMGEWLWWFPFGGMKPVSMAREGYRFYSIAEPPRGGGAVSRKKLIAALKKATGASFVLDQAIGEWRYDRRVKISPAVHKPYTASIDAALTLVPEGWRWSLDWTQRPPYQDCGRADLYAPGNGIKPPDVSDVYAATPAIALCIAALKARQLTGSLAPKTPTGESAQPVEKNGAARQD